jgi:cytochrome b6-f complex iron-sulfur subunit
MPGMSVPTECVLCTRRAVLQGIGVAVAGSIVVSAGCGGPADSTTTDGAPPDSPAGSCPTNDLCLDVTKAPYTALANAGGSVLVSSSQGRLLVIRSSATMVEALSSACTHAGVTVGYTSSTMKIDCPAHGAQFSLTGAVLRGPANTPLRSYVTTLAGNIITIKLG